METKTIVLKEADGKRYELEVMYTEIINFVSLPTICMIKEYCDKKIIYAGSVSDFLKLPSKEEIAERVADFDSDGFYNYLNHDSENFHSFSNALDSLLSAIGEYKYFILTETEI